MSEETMKPNELSDPGDFENLTQDDYDVFFGQSQEAWKKAKRVGKELENFKQFQQREYDPESGFNYFLNNLAPGLQQTVFGASQPLAQATASAEQHVVGQTMRDFDTMSGNQIGYGGKDPRIFAEAIGGVRSQFQQQLMGQQTSMLGNLLGIGLQSAPQQFQAQTDMYNRYGLASRQQKLDALQGAAGAYTGLYSGATAGMDASSNWYTPTYGDSDFDKYGYPWIEAFGEGTMDLGFSLLETALGSALMSDESLKEDIIHIKDEEFKEALGVYPVVFRWKSDKSLDYGVVAQELARVHPEMVLTNKQGLMLVRYDLIKEALNGST